MNDDAVWQPPEEPLLPGAQIVIRSEDSSIVVTLESEDGRFRATSLPPGNYLVQEYDPVGFSSTTPNKIQAWVRANTVMQVSFGDISDAVRRPHRKYFPLLQR